MMPQHFLQSAAEDQYVGRKLLCYVAVGVHLRATVSAGSPFRGIVCQPKLRNFIGRERPRLARPLKRGNGWRSIAELEGQRYPPRASGQEFRATLSGKINNDLEGRPEPP